MAVVYVDSDDASRAAKLMVACNAPVCSRCRPDGVAPNCRRLA